MKQFPMRISFSAVIPWILLFSVIAAGLGCYPTWIRFKLVGLVSMGLSAVIVLIVMLASAAVIVMFSAQGPDKAAYAFLTTGIVRIFVVIALAAACWKLYKLPHVPFFIWTGVMYLAMLIGEIVWLAKALRNDAYLAALGKIDRWDTDKNKKQNQSELENVPQ